MSRVSFDEENTNSQNVIHSGARQQSWLERTAYATGLVKAPAGVQRFWAIFILGMIVIGIVFWARQGSVGERYGNGNEINERYPNLYPVDEYKTPQ